MSHSHTPEHPIEPTRPGHGPASDHDTGLAELLDLDAALGAPVLDSALDDAAQALGRPPRAVVDLGAGTGTGTFAIARRFPEATVHSLDASPRMVEILGAGAAERGLGDRVTPHLVDLDGDWPSVLPGGVDLAWAALSLHHVTDPVEVLRQALGLLRPGGALVVIEMTRSTVHSPADLGTGIEGLGERLVAALAGEGYPVTGEWSRALEAAGFTRVVRRETSFTASADTAAGARYLELQLMRNRDIVAQALSPADLGGLDAAIAALAAGDSGLRLAAGRAIWVGVRPGGAEPAAPADVDGGAAR
jgi:SAM-dependent methyltransferase